MKPLFILLSFLFFVPSHAQFNYDKAWGTYYLGASSAPNQATIDSQGNVIIVGSINPLIKNSNPEQYESPSYYNQWATPGCYQPSLNVIPNTSEGYISKFNPEGNVEWSTYFGGLNSDVVLDLATDNENNIYVVGFTNSTTGIATMGSFISESSTIVLSSHNNGNMFGFLAKFSATGMMQWSTYLPLTTAAGAPTSIALAVSTTNDIFVYGCTISSNTNLVTTPGAFIQSFNNYPLSNQNFENVNGYILKFDGLGNRIAGTLCGPAITPTDMTIDSEGKVIIVGAQDTETNAEGLGTPDSYQQIGNALGDGFISKYSNDLSTRIWSTYYGDSVSDKLSLVTTAGTDIFVHGRTSALGTGILATAGAYSQTTSSGYLAKFSGSGSRLWGTYLPFLPNGATINSVYSMTVKNGNLYIAGSTIQTTDISTTATYQSSLASPDRPDGLMLQFSTDGVRNWGSYFGGENWEYITNISVLDDNSFYVSGYTTSATGISTPNSIQSSINYGSAIVPPLVPSDNSFSYIPCNLFLAKFSNPLSVPTVSNNLVKLAPNPTDGQFTLSGNWHVGYNNMELQLFDSLGKEVAHKDIAPFQEELHQGFDFRGLAHGLYFAKLTAGAEVLQTIKLLIK